MTTRCTINFDNPDGVYHGGQLLSGTAHVELVGHLTLRSIYINIEGFAQARWEEVETRTDAEGKEDSYTEVYTGHEQYISAKFYVLGREAGNTFELAPGDYSYKFSMQLPHQLPSSISGTHGRVHYEVMLTMDSPLRVNNQFKQPFTVISPLDLNLDPLYKQPIEQTDTKEFWCGMCSTEPLKVNVKIPFTGWAPGQKLYFHILVDNQSTIDCASVRLKIDKYVTYTADKPKANTRTEGVRVAEKEVGGAKQLMRKEYYEFIELPALPPSSLDASAIVQVSYRVSVHTIIEGCHRNSSSVLPNIVIGTIPLLESSNLSTNVITSQPTNNQQLKGPVSPPTYEEATSVGEFFKGDGDDNTQVAPFLPKYPVFYNYDNPSAPTTQTGYDPAAQQPFIAGTGGSPSGPDNALPQYPNNEKSNNGTSSPQYGWTAS